MEKGKNIPKHCSSYLSFSYIHEDVPEKSRPQSAGVKNGSEVVNDSTLWNSRETRFQMSKLITFVGLYKQKIPTTLIFHLIVHISLTEPRSVYHSPVIFQFFVTILNRCTISTRQLKEEVKYYRIIPMVNISCLIEDR